MLLFIIGVQYFDCGIVCSTLLKQMSTSRMFSSVILASWNSSLFDRKPNWIDAYCWHLCVCLDQDPEIPEPSDWLLHRGLLNSAEVL